MKKITSMILGLVAASAMAGVVEPFKQFTQADFVDAAKPGQSVWFPADTFTLSVKANTSVWLSNYVNSWFAPKPIPALNGNVYDMGAQKYGYIYKSDFPTGDNGEPILTLPNGSYNDLIHWANGETTTITYYDNADSQYTNSTTGYLLDTFDEDAEIYLVMTTLPMDGGETMDTYQYVQDANNATTMVSRQHNTVDLANNVRINFGIDSPADGLTGREFVAIYGGTGGTVVSGQPLPGLLFAGLLSLGTVFGAAKLRKRS